MAAVDPEGPAPTTTQSNANVLTPVIVPAGGLLSCAGEVFGYGIWRHVRAVSDAILQLTTAHNLQGQ
ncbi:hypothetical protein GCM10009631_15660 [Corynebacterium glaucum]